MERMKIKMEKNQIYCGDSVELLKEIDDNSVDLTVTSPPYDNLRTYEGYTFDFEGIAKELYRVTKKGGVVVRVVNDATINGSETGTSFKQALYFKEIGFNLHDTMIYAKVNPIPLNHNRYEQAFEYMFVLSKGRPNTSTIATEPCKTAGGHNMGTYYTKDGKLRDAHGKGNLVKDTKKKNNIRYYSVGSKGVGHPAIFPMQLAKDHIVSWSNEGDIVLDPFVGSGTTCVAAKQLKRDYIGIDISQNYIDIANRRLMECNSPINLK